ncbi:glycosyltransferase family 4 protein [Caulobacter sp. 17J80-11]|nr:glycosyltransferase family 4 protein [Caulobacter sp. 17J80-11]MBC6982689.1 glycosyltransferase family 4 protein [Caulobacter sp. 17J80-11]
MTADAVGGVWTYALDLARALGEAGATTVLAVLGPAPTEDQASAARAVPGLVMLDTGLPLDWTATTSADLREAGQALAALARERAVDLVHLNSPALAAEAEFAAPVVGACHSCLATWWDAVRQGPPPVDFAWRIAAQGAGYRACAALVAPTKAFADATARAYGVAAPTVVRNGRAPCARPAAKADHRFVIASGRLWDDAKGAAVLNAAAALTPAPVFAAGPLQGPTGGEAQLQRLRTLGRLDPDELAGWLAGAPVFASAALYEPFGLGVLEAAQAGCALVLSDIPTHRELWDEAARFVPPGDARALADALQEVLDDPELAAELRAAAQVRAADYTVEAMSAGVLEVYRQVLGAGRAAA